MKVNKIKLSEIIPSEYNPRLMTRAEEEILSQNLKEFGLVDPIIVNLQNNHIIGGHQRYNILSQEDDDKELKLIRLGDIGWVFDEDKLEIKDENHEKALNLALNKISGDWDYNKLSDVLTDLNSVHFNMDLTGFDKFEISSFSLDNLTDNNDFILEDDVPLTKEENTNNNTNSNRTATSIEDDTEPSDDTYSQRRLTSKLDNTEKGTLAKDFIHAPFSILSTRKKEWLDRNKMWEEIINDRGETRENAMDNRMGTSVFDSTLAEILIKWFAPTNQCNNILDPFSGDSIIGSVSSVLGHKFTGIELRKEQCNLNNERVIQFNPESYYHCDDGRNVLNYVEKDSQDLLISCPPYYDLEVYSDLENDASNQETYEEFYEILDTAFSNSIKALKDNRFATIIVSDIRDKQGFYYPFPEDIIHTFQSHGMRLYNRIILENQVGSAALRARLLFHNRKITKIHQYVLVFFKGNPRNIQDDYSILENLTEL